MCALISVISWNLMKMKVIKHDLHAPQSNEFVLSGTEIFIDEVAEWLRISAACVGSSPIFAR